MKFTGKTEKQKAFEHAYSMCNEFGIDNVDIIVKDIEIPHDIDYKLLLRFMTNDNIVSHFKDRLEEDNFEQAEIIQSEINRRNIKIHWI